MNNSYKNFKIYNIMKQTLNILRGRPWLWLWLLIAWLVPQQAAADDGYETFVDQSYLYNVFVSGTNTVTITVPCYDQEGADAWIEDAVLYASWEGRRRRCSYLGESARPVSAAVRVPALSNS